jgi:hypothetical protein
MAGDEPFLSRWSRRKLASRATDGEVKDEARAREPSASPDPPATPSPITGIAPLPHDGSAVPTAPEPLRDPATLTPEDDFRPYLRADVDEGVRRQAMRALFRDPHYNVMDGLDTYIDDYSKPDPLPEGWLAKLNQASRLGAWKEPSPEAAAAASEPPVAPGPPAPEGLAAAPEKPQAEQGFAKPPSSVSSHTEGAVISPPEVEE